MTRRLLTYSALGAAGAITFASLVNAALQPSRMAKADQPMAGALAVWSLSYFLLGALLVLRRPKLLIPWLLVAIGVCNAFTENFVSVDSNSPVFAQRADVVLFVVFAATFALLVQLFPTGRPLPGFWRWITAALVSSTAVIAVGQAFGVKAPSSPGVISVAVFVVAVTYGVGMLGSVPMLAWRFHRSRGAERAQLKWFLFSVVIALVAWFQASSQLPLPTVRHLMFAVAPVLPAVAIAIALMRYRLYDIDRVISRTTSYAVVTAVVLIVYFAVVTTASRIFNHSDAVVVAAATLLAAAVFQPILRRVQRAVDHRFNRSRYDASRIVDDFGRQLRHDVDTVSIESGLILAIEETLQPAQASLWVRGQA